MRILKRFVLIDIVIVIICGIFAFFFFDSFIKSANKNADTIAQSKKSSLAVVSTSPSMPKSKIWQIALSFNTKTQQLTLSNISIKHGTANASPYNTSPYQLLGFDKNKKVLFQTNIVIADQILYDIYFSPGTDVARSSLPTLGHLASIVSIPYVTNAETIEITKNNQTILSFHPPMELSFSLPSLVQQTYATTCSLLHIVFVSDGYADMAKFHMDIQKAEATFTSKVPFSLHTNIFDFKIVDNPITNSLGCKENDALAIDCLFNENLIKISNLVSSTYPQLPEDATYTKIVVLVDGSPQSFNGGLILGVANAIGGQFGVFQNQKFFESTATMEVLGHAVGQLYDRYIYPESPGSASDIGDSIRPPFLTNCSPNIQGESFWKNAGVTQAYKGCTSQYMYAPAPLDCGSRGSSGTVMSAAGCAGSQFDGVEQYYLQAQILPKYLCAISPTPMPTQAKILPTDSGNSVPVQDKSFNCQPDPSCISNKNLQLCALKCMPN